MPTAFNYAARSDVGMVRSNNQDSGYAGPHLLVVADGMGGHAGGDLASATVIAELFELDDDAYAGRDTSTLLEDRIARANAELGRLINDDPKLDGMGTTVTAILRSRSTLAIAHIGDSRGYLFRDDALTQITKDHSLVQNLIDDGRITEDEAATHPHRSFVTRVLTGHEGDDPDINVRQARPGDRYLLCSDGLSGFVAVDTIEEVLAERQDPGATADRLVELSLRAGAPDNVTVVIADIVDVTATSPPTQSQIVGAAAVRQRKGTRPIPVTPAQKAAALAASASKTDGEDGEDGTEPIQLAEQGPRTPLRSVLIILGALALIVTAIIGGAVGAYQWSQKQYYVGAFEGNVTVFQGVPYSVATVELSHPLYITEVKVNDLPAFQRSKLDERVRFTSSDEADDLVADLRARAAECLRLREGGTACGVEPVDATSTESGTETSTPTSTETGTRTPATTPAPRSTATLTPTRPATQRATGTSR
ncbi:MAG: protein phosphatase 2C domain-containing protein [Actinomycetia bacterium]|nr:protein phosphatase 2C domain-containing protein [Actinomycetes bacterium]